MKININCRQSGFTIIEIMIGIGIVAILMGIGIPSYQAFIKNNCLTTTSTTMVSAMQFARSEAIKRRANVSVVANVDTADVDGDTNVTEQLWDAGWTVQDNAGNTIKIFYKGGCDLTTISSTAADPTTITYDSEGFLTPSGAINVEVCDDRDNRLAISPGRIIEISATGRPQTYKTDENGQTASGAKYTAADCPPTP